MNNQPYPIYIVSLKRCPERRLHVQRQLDALGLNYCFVDAVDKRDLKSPEYRADIAHRLGLDKDTIHRECTASFYAHVACALSHVKAYNLMAEQNDAAACILEDDIVLLPDFPKILHAAQKATWDVLMLSHHSKTTRYIPATNLVIQQMLRKFPEMDCSLFPRLRRRKGLKRLLPPPAVSESELDWTSIHKLEWFLLMLMSHSATFNKLFVYSINIYRLLAAMYNPNHHIIYTTRERFRRTHTAIKIGALPIRSSQQPLYAGYDIAIPAEHMTSGMGYLLTIEMAHLFKGVINSKVKLPIDYIPWHLKEKDGIQLRILTPPCVTAFLVYLFDSAREL